jgi:hypothetical protein
MKSQNEPSPIRRVSARKYRGLGDVIEQVAKPIARAIDRVAGTSLQNCAGCAKRRDFLNQITAKH